MERKLAQKESKFEARYGRQSIARSASKGSSCAQFSEIDIPADEFVLDVLQFFFDERLQVHQLNSELRDIAVRALVRANEGSHAMDHVPRPPSGVADFTWLVSEAVQIAFRRAQNQCIYEAVRITIKLSMRSEYTLARNGISSSMQANQVLSNLGHTMIKTFEGFRSNLYNDQANHCTIGYGHLVHRGACNGSESEEFKTGINEQRADELFRQRLSEFEQNVSNRITVELSQTQYDALVCFCFNVGSGNFNGSTLLRVLNDGNYEQVPSELQRWIYAGGEVSEGLRRRRAQEAHLFSDGIYPGQSTAQSNSFIRKAPTQQELRSLGLNFEDFEQPFAKEMQAQIDWCQIRHSIIRSAVEVQGDWLTAGGNLMDESNQAVREMLIMFYRDGVGMSQTQAEATAAFSAHHPKKGWWSAAFISWCVRNAMPNPAPPNNAGFHFHMRHMAYIAQALRNRENADNTRPFWLYDINEDGIVPEDGDILCLNFGASHSYQNIRQNWFVNNPNGVATGHSHSDIVIGHFEDNGRRWIETIGGNIGGTVGSRYYSLNAQGQLVDQVLLNGTSVNNKSSVTQTVGSRGPVVFALIRLTSCANF